VRIDDVDSDGWGEIIVSYPGRAAVSGQASVFEGNGELTAKLDMNATTGPRYVSVVSGGNLNRRLVIGYGSGSQPQVASFPGGKGTPTVFLAFESKFRGGVAAVMLE
jgi:hypothetical protein